MAFVGASLRIRPRYSWTVNGAPVAAATPAHLSGVRRHMVDLLTREQLETLSDIGQIVVGHLIEPESEPAND